MKITRVAATPVCLPIPPRSYASDEAGTKREWGRLSRLSPKRPSTILEYLIVRVETDGGVAGIGEAPVDIGFFGQTLEEVQAAIDDYLGPQLVGLDPSTANTRCTALTTGGTPAPSRALTWRSTT